MSDTKELFSSFKQSIITRLEEFEDHWDMMNQMDNVSYPKHLTYGEWFDKVLEYVELNTENN